VDARVRDEPAARGSGRVRPATAGQDRERLGVVVIITIAHQTPLVVAREHHVERVCRQLRGGQVGLRIGATVEQVTDLDDPPACPTPAVRVDHTELAKQRVQRVAARMHITDHDLDRTCHR
jgi:hypothetical protein